MNTPSHRYVPITPRIIHNAARQNMRARALVAGYHLANALSSRLVLDVATIITVATHLHEPGAGTFGFVVQKGTTHSEGSGQCASTTHPGLDLFAIVAALESDPLVEGPLLLRIRSKNIIEWITDGSPERWQQQAWRRSDGNAVAHADLWIRFLEFRHRLGIRSSMPQTGDPVTKLCRDLAKSARMRNVVVQKETACV